MFQVSEVERACQMTETLLGVQISDSTICRLTDKIGNEIKEVTDSPETRSVSMNAKRLMQVDVDNLAKSVLDCCNGIIFEDDS